VPEENFWTSCCKGRLTETETLTIRLGATPSGLTNVHLTILPIFFTGRMPFLPPNQQCQSTEGDAIQSNEVIACEFQLVMFVWFCTRVASLAPVT